MERYTHYWHNPYLWSDNARDATLIGISRSTPWWRSGYKALKLLAPNRELFVWYKHDGAITADENQKSYQRSLEEIGGHLIDRELRRRFEEEGEKPLVLLCWCKPSEFCHRRVQTDWWLKKTGQEVPELLRLRPFG